MARSLTVKHEEAPATNPLLTGFLIVAALVLLASAFDGTWSATVATDAPPPAIDGR